MSATGNMLWLATGVVYVIGLLSTWPVTARRVLRHDMENRELNRRLLREAPRDPDTADYIFGAFGGIMLSAVWPIWGAGLVLGWLGRLVGRWLFPDLRAKGDAVD